MHAMFDDVLQSILLQVLLMRIYEDTMVNAAKILIWVEVLVATFNQKMLAYTFSDAEYCATSSNIAYMFGHM